MIRSVIDRKFERRLAGLVNSGQRTVLRGGKKGVEKESLRVTPQRRAILAQIGVPFDVEVSSVQELTEGPPEELVLENAFRKARAVADRRGAAIVPSLSVRANLCLGDRVRHKVRRFGLRWPKDERAMATYYIDRLSVRPPYTEARIGALSGGKAPQGLGRARTAAAAQTADG